MSSFDKKLEEELEKLKKKKKNQTIGSKSSLPSLVGKDLTSGRYSYLPTYGADIAPIFTSTKKDKDEDDDIAPVRTTTKSKKDEEEDDGLLDFFKKSSVFDDGWDAGDLTMSIVGTAGDAALNVAKGFGGVVEGVTDLAGYGAAYVGDKLGKNKWATDLRERTKESYVDKLTKPAEDVLDHYSILGRTSDAILQGVGQVGTIMATGGLASGLGKLGATAATSGLMGLSGTGSGMSEAYQNNATDKEAFRYGVAAGASDALWETVFGGMGKAINAVGFSTGLSSLDDIVAKGVSKFVKGKTGQNIAEFLVKSGFEGLEEVGAGITQAAAKKLTYMSEEEFGNILKDENLLEQFIVGAATSGVMQSGLVPGMNEGSLKEANKTGRDFISGLTDSEQKVIDKVVQDEIAQREKKGEKVSGKEKSKIYESVIRDMDKGYISIDTIEEVLGGDTYATYKNRVSQEDALQKEFDDLNGKKISDLTGVETTRKEDLRKILENIKKKDDRTTLKSQLDNTIKSQLAGSRLQESYNERERAKQDYQIDYKSDIFKGTKHYDAAQKTIKSAIKAGANNTNRVHDIVDMAAKLSSDTGVVFNFKSYDDIKAEFIERQTKEIAKLEAITEPTAEQAEKLKSLKDHLTKVQSGEIRVNGVNTGKEIDISLDSVKALDRLVGHEVTHSLEKAKSYDALKKHILAYAKTKGMDIDSEIKSRSLTYEGVNKADPEGELVADLVGDFLFNDSEYIRNLATNDRNLFQRIYDEVKHLLSLATAGSKEARQLERVKHDFEKAYREASKANSETKHHISNTFSEEIDKVLNNEMDKTSQVKARDFTPKILVNNGVTDLPMLITQNHVKSTIYSESEAKALGLPIGRNINYHGLGKDLLMKSIDNMDNPSEIYKKDDDHYLVVTEMKNAAGETIIIPVKIDGKGTYNDVYIDENQIQSAYGKKNLQNYLDRNNFELVYKKSTALNEGVQYSNIGDALNVGQSVKSDTSLLDTNVAQEEGNVKYSLVEDQKTIDFLENQEHIVTYKAMVLIDGKLYPPTASQSRVEEEYTDKKGNKKTKTVRKLKNPSVLGKWQQADERPDLAEKSFNAKRGYSSFDLLKSNGKTVPAAYNPYEHTSNIVLNDQFEEAYNRPELVTVEYHIPVSELTSGYKAEYAKDAVGQHSWKSGPVAKDLKDPRQVYLTRWSKPVRIVPDSEVAAKYKEILDGTGLSVPFNVVTPSLLSELEKAGVPIDYEGSPQYKGIKRRAAEKEANHSVSADEQENVKVLSGGSVTKYSLSTWTPEMQEKVSKNLTKAGFEKKDVDKWIKDTNSIAAVIAADKARLGFEAHENHTMVKDNNEYYKTVEASTLCAKRLEYQGTFDAIQHRLPNTTLTSDMLIELREMMKKHGREVPCGACYVESRRRHLGRYATDWLKTYDGEFIPTLADVTTTNGLEKLRTEHPDTYNDFIAAMNKKGVSNPKVVELRTEYKGEIMKISKATYEKIMKIGGLRLQSFSDFETPHLLDMMQVVNDMASRKFVSQAYTKVPNFAWVFGDTNIKINLSLIPGGTGIDANGDLIFDPKEGMDINDAMELRDRYSKNVGTTIIGINDAHILKCMADDRIDYIIPFHRSGWGSTELRAMGLDSYVDYTKQQRERDIKTGKGVENIDEMSYWDFTKSGKENAEAYLALCAEKGVIPKFEKFLVDNGDGSYSLQPDGSTDGYWKTLINFKMYDNDGVGSPHQAVLPNFNMEEAYRVLNDYEGGANSLPVAKDVVEEFVAKYNSEVAPVQYSLSDSNGRQLSEEQQNFFKDSVVRDENGTLKVMYHGTSSGGHTMFDPYGKARYGLFGAGSYFTDSKSVAEGYTKKGKGNNPQVYETYLNIKNPMDMDAQADPDAWANAFPGAMFPESGTNEDFYRAMEEYFEDEQYARWEAAEEAMMAIEDMGFDGITHIGGGRFNKADGTRHRVYIAFQPEQIKNVDNTNPTEAPDIRYSVSAGNTSRALTNEDIAPIRRSEAFGSDFFKKAPPVEDIAPVATVSETENVAPATEESSAAQEEVAPVYETEGGQQSMFPEEPATSESTKTTRKALHAGIIERVKASFAEKGFDFDSVLRKAKNLSTFATVDNTPQRVMEKALGYKEGGVLADFTVNKVAQNETEGIKWLNSFTDRKNGLLAQISKQYQIKPGSKESAAAQMYAEGYYVLDTDKNGEYVKGKTQIVQYGDKELAIDFPDPVKQAQIKGLARDSRIRQIYDDTLKAINESRARNVYPEIPRLDNYFMHFRAMEDTFSRLGLPFNPNDIRAKDLPTDLNGVTADLKPGQPFFASAMHREGKRTTFDLLGGLEKYLTSAKNQIYHIDDIQNLRALRNYLAETYGQAKGLEELDLMTEEEAQQRIEEVYSSHMSTFAKFLNEEANMLAGKTALIDRGLEGIIGRRGMTFLDTLNRQVGANMVGYNVSSSLTNFLAPVQAFAKTNKFDFVKGFAQTVANRMDSLIGAGDNFAENSPVMIRRKGADRFHRTLWQKMSDPGYLLMSAVDSISTEIIARAKYNEFTRKGMDSQKAHFETDKWVSRLMGDRSLGQQPQLYNSKMLGIFTKFQLEVRNQLDSQFYDTIQEAKVSTEEIQNQQARNAKTAAKVTSTFVQLAVAQHLFGKAFEAVAGYNPAFDIISAIVKAFGWDDDEESEDTALNNIEQGFLELLEDMPYASTFTGGRIPISSALPVEQFIKGKDQYGNDKSRWETLGEAAPYYFMPGGYGQIKKTVAGMKMFSDDHPIAGSYTDSGKLRFPVEDTFGNRAQAAIFGQWASDNARDYFDNDLAPLPEKQTQEFVDVGMSIQDYRKYRADIGKLGKLEEKIDYINGLNLTTAQKNILVNNLTDRKDPIDMSDYDEYSGLEEFDYANENPEKYAFFDEIGITYETYKSADKDTKKAYDWAFENPDKLPMSKAVARDVVKYRQFTSALNDIKADKDSSGKSISGSRKEKVLAYINGLNIDYGAKLILFKSEYTSDDDSNYEIVEYLNSRDDISYEEMVEILKELGITVRNGTAYWD